MTVKEMVAEIRADVKALAGHIDRIDRTGSIGTREELTDHESRIRSMERFRFAFPPVAVLAVIGTVLSTIVTLAH